MRTVVLPLLVLTASLAASSVAAHEETVAEARKAIEAANGKFAAAFAKGDPAGVAALYTERAVVLPPDGKAVHGRKAIESFWKSQMAAGVKEAKLKTLDVDRSGDLAAEIGRATLTIAPAGKEPTRAVAKYVVVWKRGKDGTWRLHRDIWNAAPAKE